MTPEIMEVGKRPSLLVSDMPHFMHVRRIFSVQAVQLIKK